MRQRLLAMMTMGFALSCDESGWEPEPYVPEPVDYACVGFGDAMCDGAFPQVRLVEGGVSNVPPIAVGAVFNIAPGAIALSDRRLEYFDGGIVPTREGIAALLFRDTVEHIEARPAVAIRITHEIEEVSGVFSQILGVDDFNLRFPIDRFRAVPIDADGNMLAGDLGCRWSTSNPHVLFIESDLVSNIVTFRINAPGEATLRVRMGDLVAEVPFTIEGG